MQQSHIMLDMGRNQPFAFCNTGRQSRFAGEEQPEPSAVAHCRAGHNQVRRLRGEVADSHWEEEEELQVVRDRNKRPGHSRHLEEEDPSCRHSKGHGDRNEDTPMLLDPVEAALVADRIPGAAGRQRARDSRLWCLARRSERRGRSLGRREGVQGHRSRQIWRRGWKEGSQTQPCWRWLWKNPTMRAARQREGGNGEKFGIAGLG